jgi:uncharacterized protein (TIGR01732 family)
MDYYGGYGACGGYGPCGGGQYEECPRRGSTFALIVVLFILLIIIGATFHHKC